MKVFLRESFVPVLGVLAILSIALIFLREMTEVRSRAATVIHVRAEDLEVEPVGPARGADRLGSQTDAAADDARSPQVARLLQMASHDSLPQALAAVHGMLAANSKDGTAWFAQGALWVRSGKYDAAVDAYRQAAELSTGRARAVPLYNLACLYRDLGRKAEAADAFRAALRERPNYLEARLNLAILTASAPERRADARRMYDQLVRLAPAYPEAYYNRGVLGMAEGKPDSARADFQRTVRIDSTFAKAWFNLGIVEARSDHAAAAEAAYRHALGADPSHQRARLNLAILLGARKTGRAEAHALYTHLIATSPSYVEAYYNRGLLQMSEGDLEHARADFEKAIELDSKFAKAWFNLGVLHGKAGRNDAAIAAYRGAIFADSDYIRARINLAVHLSRAKRYREAADINREIIDKDPSHARAWYNLALALGHVDDFDGAAAAYRKAIELAPDNARAWQNLGTLYARQNKSERAIACYREALAIEPANEAARYNLAIAYRRQGKEPLAQQEIARLARLAPDHPKARKLVDQFQAATAGTGVPAAAADLGGDDDAPAR